ncbi:uncharacterized protein LOC143275203 isoform X2 [Babylonia areolata]
MFPHQSLTEAYHPRDVFRGIVLAVNPDKKRIFVSLRDRAATTTKNSLSKIGLISKDDFPVHYRRKLERFGLSYGELLTSILGFANKGSVDVLQGALGLTNSASLMRGLHGVKVPEEEYAEALRKWQTNKQVHNSVVVGVEMMKKGRQLEAIQNLNMALKIDPTHTEALVARGAVYANNASYQKAIDDFEKALEGNPKHINAKKYLVETRVACARRYEEEGSVEEAVDNYREVLKLNPQSLEAKHGVERCRRLQGKEQSGKGKNSGKSDSTSTTSSSDEDDMGDNLQKSADKLMRLMKAEKKDSKKKRESGQHSPPESSRKSGKKKERRKLKCRSASSSKSSPSPHAALNKIFEEWQSQQKTSTAPPPPSSFTSKRRLSSVSNSRHRRRASCSSSSGSSRWTQSQKRKSRSRSRSSSRSSSSSSKSCSQSSSTSGSKPQTKSSFGTTLMDTFLSKGDRAGNANRKEKVGSGTNKWDDLSTYIGESSHHLETMLADLRQSKKQRSRSQSPSQSSSSDRSLDRRRRSPRRKRSRDCRDSRDCRRSRSHRRSGSRDDWFSRKERYSREGKGLRRGRRDSQQVMEESHRSRDRHRHKDGSQSGEKQLYSSEQSWRSKHKDRKSSKEMKEDRRYKTDLYEKDGNTGYKSETSKDNRKPFWTGETTKNPDVPEMDKNRTQGSVLDGRATLQTGMKDKDFMRAFAEDKAQAPEDKDGQKSHDASFLADQGRAEEIAAIIAKNGSLTVPSKWDSPTRRSRWDTRESEDGDGGQKQILVVTEKQEAAGTGIKTAEQGKRGWTQKPQSHSQPEVPNRWTRFDRLVAPAEETLGKVSILGMSTKVRPAGVSAKDKDLVSSMSSRDESSSLYPKHKDVEATRKNSNDLLMDSKWTESILIQQLKPEAAGSQVKEGTMSRNLKDNFSSKKYALELSTKQGKDILAKDFKELVPSRWDEDVSKENADGKHDSSVKAGKDEGSYKWLTETEESSVKYYKEGSEETITRWSQQDLSSKKTKDTSIRRSVNDNRSETKEPGGLSGIQQSKETVRDVQREAEDRLPGNDRDGGGLRKGSKSSSRYSEWSNEDAPNKTDLEDIHKDQTLSKRSKEEAVATSKPLEIAATKLSRKWTEEQPDTSSSRDVSSKWTKVEMGAEKESTGVEGGQARAGAEGERGRVGVASDRVSELKELMLQHLTLQRLELQHLSLKDLEQRLCQEITDHISTNSPTTASDSGSQSRPPHHLEGPSKVKGGGVEEQAGTEPPSEMGDTREQSLKMIEQSWEISGSGSSGEAKTASSSSETREVRRSEERLGARLDRRKRDSEREVRGQDLHSPEHSRRQNNTKRSIGKDASPSQQTERRSGREKNMKTTSQTDNVPYTCPPSSKTSKAGRYSQRKESEEREERYPSDLKKDWKWSPMEHEKYMVKTSSHHKDASMSSWIEKIISNVDVKPSSKTNRGDVDIRFLFRTSSGTVDSSFSHQLIPDKQSSLSSQKRRRKSSSSSSERDSGCTKRGHSSHRQQPEAKEKSKKKKRLCSSSSSSWSSSTDSGQRERLRSSAQKKKRQHSSSSASSSLDDRHRSSELTHSSSRKRKRSFSSSSSSSSSSSDDRQKKKLNRGKKNKKRKNEKQEKHKNFSSSSSSSTPSPKRKKVEKVGGSSLQKHRSEVSQQGKPGPSGKTVTDFHSEDAKVVGPQLPQPAKNKLNELENFLKELKTKKKEKLMAEGKGKKV